MTFRIEYHKDVIKEDIPKFDDSIKERIKKSIEDKLVNHPEVFGKPLKRSIKGYWKLRVGDYRVIFKIKNKTVKIFVIQHRSEVYKKSLNRLNKGI